MEGTWNEVAEHSPHGAVLAEASRHGWSGYMVIAAEALLAGVPVARVETIFRWGLEDYPEPTANYLRAAWEAARSE